MWKNMSHKKLIIVQWQNFHGHVLKTSDKNTDIKFHSKVQFNTSYLFEQNHWLKFKFSKWNKKFINQEQTSCIAIEKWKKTIHLMPQKL